jgi:hypothetical protein
VPDWAASTGATGTEDAAVYRMIWFAAVLTRFAAVRMAVAATAMSSLMAGV